MSPADWLKSIGRDRAWLAAELRVSYSTLGYWFRGTHRPDDETIFLVERLSQGAVTGADWLGQRARAAQGRKPRGGRHPSASTRALVLGAIRLLEREADTPVTINLIAEIAGLLFYDVSAALGHLRAEGFVAPAGAPIRSMQSPFYADFPEIPEAVQDAMARWRRNRPRLRTCLRCDQPFLSEHPGNRRCALCDSAVRHHQADRGYDEMPLGLPGRARGAA